MKKVITTAFLFISLTALSQKSQPQTTKAPTPKDSTYLRDTTEFLSLKTIDRIMATKKNNISVGDWEVFYAILNRFLLPDAIREFETKAKQSANKK